MLLRAHSRLALAIQHLVCQKPAQAVYRTMYRYIYERYSQNEAGYQNDFVSKPQQLAYR